MTNETRKVEIQKNFGNLILSGDSGLVKTASKGWHIVLKDERAIKLNGNSNVVKGKAPGGLLEAYVELRKLAKKLDESKKPVKVEKPIEVIKNEVKK